MKMRSLEGLCRLRHIQDFEGIGDVFGLNAAMKSMQSMNIFSKEYRAVEFVQAFQFSLGSMILPLNSQVLPHRQMDGTQRPLLQRVGKGWGGDVRLTTLGLPKLQVGRMGVGVRFAVVTPFKLGSMI
jgi:hypothetical protein